MSIDIKQLTQGDLMGHIKTGTAYQYLGKVKCKVDGVWVDMYEYERYIGDPEKFCRFEWDFEGFELIGRNI